ncbi:hypothetical protein PR048_016946 [Dryococelus australis]|uniref:Cytochrome P450 n=1 Tax=Dryococelus australis TaxID=614101 RepID=A0ABQ9H8B2_9NEOP|nr:hypothetical protein PR048_016946 [Dryococelus australis]
MNPYFPGYSYRNTPLVGMPGKVNSVLYISGYSRSRRRGKPELRALHTPGGCYSAYVEPVIKENGYKQIVDMNSLMICTCFSVVAANVVTIFVAWYVSRNRYYQLGNKIPGPPGLPLLVNTLSFIARNKDILEYIKELRRSHGPVFQLWIGHHLLVTVITPRDIAIVFNRSLTLSKPAFYSLLKLVFRESLLTTDTDEWKKIRRIKNPTFTHQVIDRYVSTFYKKSLAMTEHLEKHSMNGPFNAIGYTKMCTLDMVTETSLGVAADIRNNDQQHFIVQNTPKLFRMLSYFFFRPWFWIIFVFTATRSYTKIVQLVERIRDFIDIIVSNKLYLKYKTEKYTFTAETKQRQGFLDHMISTMVNNPGLITAEELRDQAMFVMAAATDTSALATVFTLMLLGLHQDVQRKLMREQENIFGEDMDRPLTASDLKKMVYLEQVINESMRMADEEVRIGDFALPAGTIIIIPIYLVHRDPFCYPEPGKFDPDKFNKENSSNRPACSFIPFASGRRMCIGKYCAYVVIKTMLSVMLRRYEVLEYGSGDNMECVQFKFLLKMRLAYSPPTKAIQIQSPARSLRIVACGNRVGRCRWSADFLGDLSFPPPFHSGAAPNSPRSPSSALKTSIVRNTLYWYQQDTKRIPAQHTRKVRARIGPLKGSRQNSGQPILAQCHIPESARCKYGQAANRQCRACDG